MPTKTKPGRLSTALSRFPLALKRDALPALIRHADDGGMGDGMDPMQPIVEGDGPPNDGVLIMPIRGLIAPRIEDIGYCDMAVTLMDRFMSAIDDAATDPNVRGVVLDISSPGGISWLVMEAAAKIRALALLKPVRAVANAQAASAAYWLMTAAGQRYVTPSGEVGSVGVWSMHVDQSKMLADFGLNVSLIFAGQHKIDGNSFEPLSDAARADMQKSVDECYAAFTGDVAKYMGVSVDKVLADFGQGRCLSAADAMAAGMVEGVATLDDVVTMLRAELQAQDMANLEPRAEPSTLELRSIDGLVTAEGTIAGRAVPYSSPSQDLGGFREVFEPGAFTASIGVDDIRVIWQHKPECVFGRVRAGTATIREGPDGVFYSASLPNTQWARDAAESIKRGDVTGNSFAFQVAEPRKSSERWERRSDGLYRVISAAKLVEVGPQTHPAYLDTTVAVRSMNVALAENTALAVRAPAESAELNVDFYRDRLKVIAASM